MKGCFASAVRLNRRHANDSATDLVQAAVARFGARAVVTTSFGIQSAVMLHMVTRIEPQIPIVWVDTGYLPAETYRYADELTETFTLNLFVYQSRMSPARMEALYGRLWEHPEPASLDRYHHLRKVEPLHRALRELHANAWLAGVRGSQTEHRATFRRVQRHGRYCKFHPLLNWSDTDVEEYFERNRLPRHPLAGEGYVTVGDAHLSRPATSDDSITADAARATRFGGRKQECGIHVADGGKQRMISIPGLRHHS